MSHPLITALADLSDSVRYVAIHDGEELESWERSRGDDSSSKESDRYEELLVNPTLLSLLEARGALGCGGLEFVVIRYGNFFQLVQRIGPGAHLSVCISKEAHPLELQKEIAGILSGQQRRKQ